MRRFIVLFLGLVSAQCFGQFKNVTLTEDKEGFKPRNPTVAINHKDQDAIVVGVSPNHSFYSSDGGVTWNESTVTSGFGGGTPEVISDQKGHIFYFQQSNPAGVGPSGDSWLDRIVCTESKDGGKSWGEERFFGMNPPKDQSLFHVTIHPKKSILYSTWTQFDQYKLEDAGCQSNIFYSMSMNEGSKWTKPVQLSLEPGDCKDGNNTVGESMPAVNLDGKIYAAWFNKGTIFFDRSYDGGETWLSNDLAIHKRTGERTMYVPGFGQINSGLIMQSDISPTRAQTNLYIVYTDQKKGGSDADIYLMRSANKGDNWTSQFRINNDEKGKYHFLPAMTIDQTSGYIYIIYYDRRAFDDTKTDVYLAYSFNAGETFAEVKISDTPFEPTDLKIQSGYTSISSQNGVIVPVWTRNDNGKVSIMTTVITTEELRKIKH